jgi:Flp pilus assembly protein protease CpaA
MNSQQLLQFAAIIHMSFMAFIDIRYKHIRHLHTIFFVIISIAYSINDPIKILFATAFFIMLLMIVGLCTTLLKKNIAGGADIKLIPASLLWVPLELWGMFFIMLGILAIVVHLIYHMKSLQEAPFIPALLISLMLSLYYSL